MPGTDNAAANATPPPAETAAVERKRQYMVAPNPAASRLAAGLTPFGNNVLPKLEQILKDNPNIEYIRTLQFKGISQLSTLTRSGIGAVAPDTIVVAKMDEAQAEALRLTSGGQLVVERDRFLSYTPPTRQIGPGAPPLVPSSSMATPATSSMSFTIAVRGKDSNAPLPDATVILYGPSLPAQGITGPDGKVTLTIFGATPDTLRGITVIPKHDYWDRWLARPALNPTIDNVITVAPLSDSLTNFPAQQTVGWGQKAMKMDKLPSQFQGQGVRIAVIDSGAAANTHQDLQPLFKGGLDLTASPPDADGWANDTVGHGSHCSGIISGLNDANGIRGFAPGADIYAFKIFPGGAFSDLICALDQCIDQQIDVVNLSLGSEMPSELVAIKFQQARELGVACIVAAGNSGGAVQFPASLPSVLSVAAIGKKGEFPPDSFHATQVAPPGADSSGYFSASFTCYGPEVDVCAPGVAVVSSVPPNNFAAWDGTSMAAPHVTGLAALILAHHPDFQPGGPFSARDGRRVDRLFQILKQSAQPVAVADPTRVGTGLPDAVRAFNLVTQPRPPAPFGALQPEGLGLPPQALAEVVGAVTREIAGRIAAPSGNGAHRTLQPLSGSPIAPPPAAPPPGQFYPGSLLGGASAPGPFSTQPMVPPMAAPQPGIAPIQWLSAVLQQTGVLPPQSAAPQGVAPQSAAAQPPGPAVDLSNTATMQWCADALAQAGLR